MATVAAPPDSPRTKVEDKNFLHLAIIIIAGIFATTLPQPQVLGRLPITFLLKEQLHCSRGQVALFFLACGLAWYIKPIMGLATDAFPIFGTRRRHYMMIGSALAAVSWIALGLLNHSYVALLIGAIIVNFFMVMASTVTGAFLVEAGQSYGATGRLTSLRMFVQNACTFITGPLGGWLAGGMFFRAAGVNSALILTLLPITYLFLRERKIATANLQVFHTAGEQLKTIGRSSTLWWGLVFIFLFYFAPGFGTVLTYRQSDDLHFSKQFIGNLGSFQGGFGLLAAVVYGYASKRFNLRTLIFVGVTVAGLAAYAYLWYTNATRAMIIDSQNGFFFTLAEIALIDLAARATPVGCEGLGYGLIMSVRNFALFSADWLGSKMSDQYHFAFSKMVIINGTSTLIVLVLLPFLPAAIMRSRDKAIASEPDPDLRAPEDDI